MKVLVIPDVHLKPKMFRQAEKLMKKQIAERVVCLMDIADDWMQQYNLDIYMETYDTAIRFARQFPETLWCYGNHDVSYPWAQKVTGYSPIASRTVCEKLVQLITALPDEKQLAFIHRIDDVIFLHAGLTEFFVQTYLPEDRYDDVDHVIETINGFGYSELWHDDSPIWYRPQYYGGKMYQPDKLLQVVGHTPVTEITRSGNVISCDVFSTDRNRKPIGTQEYLLIDTKTWEYKGIKDS